MTQKTTLIAAKVSPEYRDKAHAVAEAKGTTVAAMIRRMFDRAIKAQDKKDGKET